MNIERVQLSPHEIKPITEAIDFAEIRNPLGASPLLLERLKEKAGTTEGNLTRELARLWRISPDMIVIGHGSTDLIDQIPILFLNHESTAVLPVPTYFGLLDKVPNERVVQVPMSKKDGFSHTPEHLQALLSVIHKVRPELVWLCSPNNPTGVVMSHTQIERVVEISAPGLVVVDEAYQELVDPNSERSAIHLIGNHPNLIVTRTFSKAYGLPEIHVGMAVASPEIIEKLRHGRTREVNPDSLAKANAALADQKHIWKSHFLIAQESEWVWKQIHEMDHIEMGAQSQSGVCIIRHASQDLWQRLKTLGIITTNFNEHRGLKGQRFVRLGLLDHERNVKLIEALRLSDIP